MQALPKGMGPLAACSGAAAMEQLALPPRDQHVSGPAQTSLSERKDPPLLYASIPRPPHSSRPPPPKLCLQGGQFRLTD